MNLLTKFKFSSSKNILSGPQKDCAEDLIYWDITEYTLNTGKVIEICIWEAYETLFIDISMNKKEINLEITGSFQQYLEQQGIIFPAKSIQKTGNWVFAGEVEKDDVYCLQLYQIRRYDKK